MLVFVLYRGFRGVALYVQLMMGLGILMMVLFLDLYFAPWRRFRLAVARQDWVEGGRQLGQIRAIVTINLVLGPRRRDRRQRPILVINIMNVSARRRPVKDRARRSAAVRRPFWSCRPVRSK